MRVGLFIGSLRAGGIAKSFLKVSEGLVQTTDIDLLVLTAKPQDYRVSSGIMPRIRFLDPGGYLKWWQVCRWTSLLLRYVSLVRRHRYDIIVSAGIVVSIINVLFKNAGRYRAVVSLRTDWRRDAEGTYSGLGLRVYRCLWRWLLRRADHILSVTETAGRELMREFGLAPDKVSHIYNPFDIAALQSAAREPLPPEYEGIFDGQTMVIVGIGRLVPQKGFDQLIMALGQVRRRIPNAHLVILGKGSEEKPLVDLAERLGLTRSVSLLGFQSNPYRFLARSDVFVLSSRWEGIANALVEALICGVPVISTDCPSGPREVLTLDDETLCGLLVPVDSPSALADAIVELWEDKALRAELTARGHRRVQEFSDNTVLARWVDCFRNVLSSADRRGDRS